MKNWKTPSIDSLEVKFTEHGQCFSKNFDEIRVDESGNYWISSSDGEPIVLPEN
ncbi:MAG: hypothetical protein PUC65_01505 [Clostridiales bacterium]|nr:hypothetical protein [Clostridiales bacterium]